MLRREVSNHITSCTSIRSIFCCLTALKSIDVKGNHRADGRHKGDRAGREEGSLKLMSRMGLVNTGLYSPVGKVSKHSYHMNIFTG